MKKSYWKNFFFVHTMKIEDGVHMEKVRDFLESEGETRLWGFVEEEYLDDKIVASGYLHFNNKMYFLSKTSSNKEVVAWEQVQKMNALKMRQLEFLNEMVAHYSVNPEKRRCVAFNEKGARSCKYSPKTISKLTSRGCAIGRRVSPDTRLAMDSIVAGTNGTTIIDDRIFNLAPKWMQELGKEFLQEVQQLHDTDEYWNETGLTKSGEWHRTNITAGFYLTQS